MTDLSDSELLAQFARTQSEAAFATLVARHIGLVHSVAERHTANASAAQDITQAVFIILARKAAALKCDTVLAGWLYQTARNTAANFRRAEASRVRREQEAYMESTLEETPSDPAWSELSPLLDTAMSQLGATDRDALVLRYFQNKNLSEVAAATGVEERTAQKRVQRAVEKLRRIFERRGVTLTATAIIGAVSANSVKGAPAGLVKTVTTAALAKGAAGGTASILAAAKAAGAVGLLATLWAPLTVILHNYLGYRFGLLASEADEERAQVKTLFRKVAAMTMGIFIPFAGLVLWLVPDQTNCMCLLASGFVLIYTPTMLTQCIASKEKSGEYYSQILAQEQGGVFPKAAWEYRSQANVLGLPLIHIRIGDRFGVLKGPVKAWIAVGNRAIGGLAAFGCIAVAPLSMGWLSMGLFSVGGLSIGVFAMGGISLGVWALFGALAAGWQAFGALAIAWKVADGDIALAHDFAAGHLAMAAQANNLITKQVMEPTLFFRSTHVIANYWYWLNLIWLGSSLIEWRVSRKNAGLKAAQ